MGPERTPGRRRGERMDQTLDTPGVPTPYLCSAADPDPPIPLLYAVRIKVPPLWRRSWGLLWSEPWWSGERWWSDPWWSEPWWSEPWWSEPWWSEGLGPRRRWLGPRAGWC